MEDKLLPGTENPMTVCGAVKSLLLSAGPSCLSFFL